MFRKGCPPKILRTFPPDICIQVFKSVSFLFSQSAGLNDGTWTDILLLFHCLLYLLFCFGLLVFLPFFPFESALALIKSASMSNEFKLLEGFYVLLRQLGSRKHCIYRIIHVRPQNKLQL